MSGRKRHQNHGAGEEKGRFESRMENDEPVKQKKSLGMLRPAEKTHPRSPDATGKLKLQRHTFMEIARQFKETGGEEVVCNIAAWANRDQDGKYLSVELSPWFRSRQQNKSRRGFLDFISDDEDE